MASVHTYEPVLARSREQSALTRLENLLGEGEGAGAARLIGPGKEEIEMPQPLYNLFRQLVHDLARGRIVSIVSGSQELTTQQAADLLNVSRPYLVKLLEEGKIPFAMVGNRRRVHFNDLMAYKQQRDIERKRGLALLTQMAQEMGDYD